MQWGQDLEIYIEVSVDSEHGGASPHAATEPTTAKTVSYTVELIVFDYTIAPYIELTDV